MMTPSGVLAILLGALLAAPYALWAGRARGPARIFAVGLVVAALVYVPFAIARGGGSEALLLEAVGVVVFGGLALIGASRSLLLLAIAWMAHVAWDLLLHPVDSAGYAPWWYPLLCVGFDLVVAGFILAMWRSSTLVAGSGSD